jgi:hypothetical protein
MPTIGIGRRFPLAPGTFPDCLYYANGHIQQFPGPSSNRCSYVAESWEVTVSHLTTWNPSLNKSNCEFQLNLSYCVLLKDETYGESSIKRKTYLESDRANYSVVPKPLEWDGIVCDVPRGDIVNGTDDSCVCFTSVYEYDKDSTPPCRYILCGICIDNDISRNL